MVRPRDAVFERWRSAIQRETRDAASLDMVGARALNDPAVRSDPGLQGMIQSYVAERRVELREIRRETDAAERAVEGTTQAPTVAAQEPPSEARERPAAIVVRLTNRLRHHLTHFEEREAKAVLAEIQEVADRNPGEVEPGAVARCKEEFEQHVETRRQIEAQIKQLVSSAVTAGENADQDAALRSLRQLSSIRASHPQLLSEESLAKIRREVIVASERHEHKVAAKQLIDRERALAEEIKKLASTIRGFHRLARKLPRDGEEYRRAERAYSHAVGELRAHDSEWLAAVILELTDLLSAWDDPPPATQKHVDEFLERVGSTLSELRAEVKEIEKETGATHVPASPPTRKPPPTPGEGRSR